jgi:glutamate/tyrosine decarboxylase-like PLP-dependent enzyme
MSADDLRDRRSPLEMSPQAFREAGHWLVDETAAFLESLPRRPVTRDEAPSALRALLPAALEDEGVPPGELLAEAAPLLFDHSLLNGHPSFLSYITSSAAPIGALGDLLAAAVNPNVGAWQLSPIASEIEGQCIRWLAGLLGMPSGTEGLLVSGGNVANFACFLTARRAKAGEGVREAGVHRGGPRLLAYASTETHTWLQKATDLFGLGTASLRWIPVRDDLTIDVEALERRIEEDLCEGHQPFLLVGNAGTVSTGAVDPLARLAAIARRHDLWFHADGAYGAPAVVSAEAPAGLAEADSVASSPPNRGSRRGPWA